MSRIDAIYNMHLHHQTAAECFQNFQDWSDSDSVWLIISHLCFLTDRPADCWRHGCCIDGIFIFTVDYNCSFSQIITCNGVSGSVFVNHRYLLIWKDAFLRGGGGGGFVRVENQWRPLSASIRMTGRTICRTKIQIISRETQGHSFSPGSTPWDMTTSKAFH